MSNFTNHLPRDGKDRPLIVNPATGQHVAYQRVSNLGKGIEDQTALTGWKMRALSREIASSPKYSQAIRDADDKALNAIIKGALEAQRLSLKADIGSYIHYRLELRDRGEADFLTPSAWAAERGMDLFDSDIPEDLVIAILSSWMQLKNQFGVVCLQIEEPRVHHGLKVAGTPDRVVVGTHPLLRQPVILDFKTGRDPSYPAAAREHSIQMAVYQRAGRYDTVTEQIIPDQASIRRDFAIICHVDIPTATCALYRLDTTRAGGRTDV